MRVSTVSVEDIKKCRLITAIKTPYNTNGSIDIPAFDRMMEAQIAAGVEGVVVGGTTGNGAVKRFLCALHSKIDSKIAENIMEYGCC